MAPPEKPAFIVRGDDGEEYGPVDLAELHGWVRENRAGLGTNVRRDEPGARWQAWQHYPELVALLAEARATGAAAGAVVVAPLFRRALAFALDLILAYLLLIPIGFVVWIAFFPESFVQYNVAIQLYLMRGQEIQYALPFAAQAGMILAFAAVVTLYMAGFHFAHGQTPAKSILRLRVVDQNGRKPGAAQALVRGAVLGAIFFCFSFFPPLFLFPFILALFQPQRRAIHDLAAGTHVVEA
jgi:uncharacterized RDD family membrane protein YckC